jgi:hypothetical protein
MLDFEDLLNVMDIPHNKLNGENWLEVVEEAEEEEDHLLMEDDECLLYLNFE